MTFVALLFLMVGLAWFFPEPGAMQGALSPHAIANYLVSLIFLLYGIGLDVRQLCEGLANWRLHVVVQSATFLLFPLLVLAFLLLPLPEGAKPIWLGIFYLAALPSTVSSSVVMVAMARGNIPAAIFNASFSGVIGIVVTPLWMSLFFERGAGGGGTRGDYNPLHAVLSLATFILLPILLGMLLHSRCGPWVKRHRATLRLFDQSVILMIVFCSFGESFASHAFQGLPLLALPLLTIGMIALFGSVYGIIGVTCRLLGFSREDAIAATFCGSKKSLMHGTVMAKVLLVDASGTGLVLLPLMFYHALQLVIVALIVARLRHDRSATETS